jgi:protein-L-isoaspartate(D-aspartate) O-methyltransferase
MTTATGTSPDELRHQMVDRLAAGQTLSGTVEAALRRVPRHRFLPATTIEDAYADQSVTTKPGRDRPLSCASQPTIVATMLEQLDARPGDRILEVGAGTGYNAALLAELVGETGEVTTIDIYPDVAEQARHALTANGYGHVRVVAGDGALGDPARAPYDRIIVAVGPGDIPPAWIDQLVFGGRLVVPLQWRGQARSIAFDHDAGHLRSDSSQLCGFIPMLGQTAERSGPIDTDSHVVLHYDTDQPVDLDRLTGVLTQPATTRWSGTTIAGNESLDLLWLRLTGAEAGTCRIAATPEAVQAGLCIPAIPTRSPAIVEGSSLAYLRLRRHAQAEGADATWELGATSHGPAADHLADRLVHLSQAWGHDRTAQPQITAHPATTPTAQLPAGLAIVRPHTQFVMRGLTEPSG